MLFNPFASREQYVRPLPPKADASTDQLLSAVRSIQYSLFGSYGGEPVGLFTGEGAYRYLVQTRDRRSCAILDLETARVAEVNLAGLEMYSTTQDPVTAWFSHDGNTVFFRSGANGCCFDSVDLKTGKTLRSIRGTSDKPAPSASYLLNRRERYDALSEDERKLLSDPNASCAVAKHVDGRVASAAGLKGHRQINLLQREQKLFVEVMSGSADGEQRELAVRVAEPVTPASSTVAQGSNPFVNDHLTWCFVP